MYIDPKWVLVDLLRTHLVDPRARAEESNTESFTATAAQTNFELSPPLGSVSVITSVTVDGNSKSKWGDYTPNFEDQELDFLSGLSGGEIVAVTYKYGTSNWIYPEKPNETLKDTAFPRMNILIAGGSGARLGNYDASVDTALRIQVDIWTKEKADNQIFTISSKKYTGEKLATYLAFQVMHAFEDHEEDLFPILSRYVPLGPPRDLGFDDIYQAHHKISEFMIAGTKLGRS